MRQSILILVFSVALILATTSCRSSDGVDPDTLTIAGNWLLVDTDADTDIRTYTRHNELAGQRQGYAFLDDGVLLVRASGWCGTPPLTYSNLEGAWHQESSRKLILEHYFAKRKQQFRLEIISLTATQLDCRVTMME